MESDGGDDESRSATPGGFLQWDTELLEGVVTATGFDRMRETRHDHRHRRRGQVGSWRDELDAAEVELVVARAGPLLEQLGYALG